MLPSFLDLLEPLCDPPLPDLSRSLEDVILVLILLLWLVLVGGDPALCDLPVLSRLLDPPIPASKLDRCDPTWSHAAKQRANQFTRLREQADQPSHHGHRLLARVLPEFCALKTVWGTAATWQSMLWRTMSHDLSCVKTGRLEPRLR